MSTESVILVSNEIKQALKNKAAVVALESAVISHGLPRPHNLQLAHQVERDVRESGALPATIALLDGVIRVGLEDTELERLANDDLIRKIGPRDLTSAILKHESGGTTVGATLFIAHKAGIKIFATGGIGGVHPGSPFDVSADLPSLATKPLVVVCAGPKAILDIPATLEVLETMSVPVVGYQTDELPLFYSRASGLPVSVRLDTVNEIAAFTKAHWDLGWQSAVLVVQPVSEAFALPIKKVSRFIQQAVREAEINNVHGQALTPFLLNRLAEISNGETLKTNLELLRNNATLAAKIATAFQIQDRQRKA